MSILAYHFVDKTLRDGRPIPPDGEWLVHEDKVVMCESGLHASRHPYDALKYAPGETLCLVECEDIVEEQNDKLVCRRRRIIRRIDATDLLRLAARRFAQSVLHLWDAPEVVRRYLETGDESLRKDAAAAAAYATADAAVNAAAAATAYAAATAAVNAAYAAAYAAYAAYATADAANRDLFKALVDEAFA